MARNFMANNKPTVTFPGSEAGHSHSHDTKEEPSWKEKSEGDA